MGQLICRPRIESVRESVLDQPCVVLINLNSITEGNHLQRLDEIDDSEEAGREETRRKKKSWRWHSRRKTYNIAKAEKLYQVVTGDNIDDLQEAPISSSGVVFTAEAQVEQAVLQPAVLDMPANPSADDNTDSPVNSTVYESFESAVNPAPENDIECAASPKADENTDSSTSSAADGDIDAAVNPAPENDIECAASPKADENTDSSVSSAADGDIDAAVNPAPENNIECAASPKADENTDSSTSSAADGDIDAAVNPAPENNIECAASPKADENTDSSASSAADGDIDAAVNPAPENNIECAASPKADENTDSSASSAADGDIDAAVNPAPENNIECAASPKADENTDSSVSSAADGDIDAAVNPAPENDIECAASPKADENTDSSTSSAADGDIESAVNPAPENDIGCAANPKVNGNIDSAWHHTEIQNKNCISHRYTFGEVLGKGSFGSVQKGVRIKDGLKVAVKCVQKRSQTKYISTPFYPKPLPLEIALAVIANRAPSCPNIIKVLDWQDDEDNYVMVMEHPSPSMDMCAFLNLNKCALKEHIAQHIMRQVIYAVSICCYRGVFHGDVKLSNLLINVNTLEVKLIDFGCGDLISDSAYKSFRGTKHYISPEYYDTGRYHAKPATVFSLGVLLFTMVNGRYPTDQDKSDLINYFWSKFAVSRECCHFMQACLRHNPEHRLLLDHMHCHDWLLLRLSHNQNSYNQQ